jgi:CTP-dependent riboflavin kinase
MEMKGVLVSGLEEGKIYVRRYNKYFFKHCGYYCYPGTLNVKIDGGRIDKKALMDKGFVRIKPDESYFYDLKCIKVKINNQFNGAIILPLRTKHRGILEVISPIYLRGELDLVDGDAVKLKVIGSG